MRLRRFAAAVLGFSVITLAAFAAHAQPIATVPVNPVAGSPFLIRVWIGCVAGFPMSVGSPVVNGANIDFHVTFSGGCIATFIPNEFDAIVGPLAAGTYTVRLFVGNSTSPFVTYVIHVTADVPALDPRVLAMLAITLIVLAMLRLRVR